MNRLILISVVCMQLGWISGAPKPEGVGVFAYQDSNGNRYGGTYGLNDDQVRNNQEQFHQDQEHFHHDLEHFMPVPFGPDFEDFFPEYFRNFEKLLQEIESLYEIPPAPLQPLRPLPPLKPLLPFPFPRLFSPLPPLRPLQPLPPLVPFMPLLPLSPLRPLPPLLPFPSMLPFPPLLPPLQPLRFLQPLLSFLNTLPAFNFNKDYQKKALDSAKKAYDITSNQAGFMNFDFSRFAPYNGLNNFAMPNFGSGNAAYAAGAVMPGLSHQIAAINPANPNQPNVNVKNRFSDTDPNNSGFMSVSSTSYSTSSNVNGQEVGHRGAETVVNNNGVVHRYKVES